MFCIAANECGRRVSVLPDGFGWRRDQLLGLALSAGSPSCITPQACQLLLTNSAPAIAVTKCELTTTALIFDWVVAMSFEVQHAAAFTPPTCVHNSEMLNKNANSQMYSNQ